MFTGVRAIEGTTIAQIFSAILHQQVDFNRMRTTDAPPALVALAERMSAKDPAKRPASFLEVIAELKRIDASLRPAAGATPIPASSGYSGKKLMIGLISLIVVLTVVTIYMVSQNRAGLEGRKADGSKLDETITTETGTMKLVTGGPFKWGSDGLSAVLPAFYVDQTEVTNADYRKFCEAKGRPLPEGLAAAEPRFPVVNVAAIDAKDFCAWAGKKLPSPPEWEKAARGSDQRIYPWGMQADPSRANVSDNPEFGGKTLAAADAMLEGASPYGALNMTGNVLEWVDEARAPSAGAVEAFSKLLNPPASATEPWYLIKGGSFDRPLEHGVLYEWITVPARFTAPNIGFRCIQIPRQ
jgi:serine/threonine-protein kinase